MQHLQAARAARIERKNWVPFAAIAFVLALVFGALAVSYVRRYGLPFAAAAGIYSCFIALILMVVAPAVRASRHAVADLSTAARSPFVYVAIWCIPYLMYAAGTGDFRWPALMKLLGVAALPVIVYSLFPVRKLSKFHWQDAVVAIVLVLTVLLGRLHGVWNIPVNLDFLGRLFLIAIGSWCWVFLRRVPGLGYEAQISGRTLRAASLNFGYFAVIAIPLGFLLRFTSWNPRWHGIGQFCIDYVEIFLFIAVLEELFFRGFLQTLLSNSLRSAWKGQAVAACIFGLFHILHAPFPNWRYVVLASIAGLFYGSAFRAGGGLMASALMHAVVDTVWRTWFTRQ